MRLNDLEKIEFSDNSRLNFDHDLSRLNWFNIGGKAKIFFYANSLKDLYLFLKIYNKRSKIFILGAGSNILFDDKIFEGVVIKLGKNFNNISKLNDDLRLKSSEIDNSISIIQDETKTLDDDIKSSNEEVIKLKESSSVNSEKISFVNDNLTKKQQLGIIIFCISFSLILIVYILLSKKWNNEVKKLATKQKKILEKQIQDSQKLTDWFSSEASKNLSESNLDIDHSFAKRVADEITRITTNLSRMDNSIKGHKQLSASVRKLEQSLNFHKYELVPLLNKPYNEGMNIQATTIIDESLSKGESIITRIIKPQINYKGKLIQSAQVEVSIGE